MVAAIAVATVIVILLVATIAIYLRKGGLANIHHMWSLLKNS
jgi:hypothetical protein